jgi:hypothetical protein
MQTDTDEVQCPFCGGYLDDLTGQQIGLLRAAVLSDILPALLHDMKRHFNNALLFNHYNEHMLVENAPNEQLLEALKKGEFSLLELGRFFDTLWDLCRAPDHDLFVEVSELPQRMEWIWEVFGLRPPPDIAVLREGQGRIRFAPYRDALIFSIHAALISIRRDRNPDFGLALHIINNELCTMLKMGHHEELDADSIQWRAFRSALKHAGGTTQTTHSGGNTSVEWSVPLASGYRA